MVSWAQFYGQHYVHVVVSMVVPYEKHLWNNLWLNQAIFIHEKVIDSHQHENDNFESLDQSHNNKLKNTNTVNYA